MCKYVMILYKRIEQLWILVSVEVQTSMLREQERVVFRLVCGTRGFLGWKSDGTEGPK